MPTDCLIFTWDLELTGNGKITDQEVFDFGTVLYRYRGRHEGSLVEQDEYGSLVQSTQAMSTWVRNNIALPAGVTAAKLCDAPTLESVVGTWLDMVGAEADKGEGEGEEGKEGEQGACANKDCPIILAGHNAHAVDFPATYWQMLEHGLDPYERLQSAGVIGVLDTLKLAKQLPPAVVARLGLTAAGNPSYSNSSLFATLVPGAPPFAAHSALPDARATGEVLASNEMVALLQEGDLKGALISLDQMVLKVHTDYNKRFDSAALAAGQKRPRTCGSRKDDDDDDDDEPGETMSSRLRSGAADIPLGPPPAISLGLEVLCAHFEDAEGQRGEFGAPCRCVVRALDVAKRTATVVYTDTDQCSDVPFSALAQAGWDDGPFEGISIALASDISKGYCAQVHEHKSALIDAPYVEIEEGAVDFKLWRPDIQSEAASSLSKALWETLGTPTAGARELVGDEVVRRLGLRPGGSLQLLNALVRTVRPSVYALLWRNGSDELRSLANMVAESASAFAGAIATSACAQLIDHLPQGGCRPQSISLVPNWPLALLYDEKEHVLIAHSMDFLIATLAEKAGTAGFDSSLGSQTIRLLAWLQRELQVVLLEHLLELVEGRPSMLRALLKQPRGTHTLWQRLPAQAKVSCLICRSIGARLYHDPLGELCGPMEGTYSGAWLRHRLEAYHIRSAPLTPITIGSALERLVSRRHGISYPVEVLMALRCGAGDLWIHCVDSKNLMCEVVSALGYRAGVLEAALSTLSYVSVMERQLPPCAGVIQDSTTVAMGVLMGCIHRLCERQAADSATRLIKEAHATDGISLALSLGGETQVVLCEYRSRGELRPWQGSIGGVFAAAPGGEGGDGRRRRALFRTLQLPRRAAADGDGLELEAAAAAALGVGQRYRPRLIALAGGHVQSGQLPDTIWAVWAAFQTTGASILYDASFGSAIFASLEHSDAAAQHALSRRHEGTLRTPIDASEMLEPYRSLIETVLADRHRRRLLRLPDGGAVEDGAPLVSVYAGRAEPPPASLSAGSHVEAVFDAHEIKKRAISEADWCRGVILAINEEDLSGVLTYDIAFDPDASNAEGDLQEGVSAAHVRVPVNSLERSRRRGKEEEAAREAAAAVTRAREAREASVGKRGYTLLSFYGGDAGSQMRPEEEGEEEDELEVIRRAQQDALGRKRKVDETTQFMEEHVEDID